jgi:deoxyribose-phosphate aldolase
MSQLTRDQLTGMIDHAVLSPTASADDVASACDLCERLGVTHLCVRPCDVFDAARRLMESPVVLGTVVGFPHGSSHTQTKTVEASEAIGDGARELDMVANLSWLIAGEIARVCEEITAVREAAPGAAVKVILECCWLTDGQIIGGCEAAARAGAQFVKTSTGFGEHGATVEHVRLMRRTVGDRLGVKAAGGIRTLDDALAMIEAGATRIGTSSTEDILQAWDGR